MGKTSSKRLRQDIDTVLLVTISDKKAQQDTIDNIKSQLDYYKELIRKNL